MKLKKLAVGLLISAIASSSIVMPASALAPQTCSGTNASGTSYSGRTDLYESHASTRTTSGRSTSGVYAKTTFQYKNSLNWVTSVSAENSNTGSTSARANNPGAARDKIVAALGEHGGEGWSSSTMDTTIG